LLLLLPVAAATTGAAVAGLSCSAAAIAGMLLMQLVSVACTA
jgi:hypothetical protein